MAVHDKTYFGPGLDSTSLFYGDVRRVTDEEEKLQLLKLRLDAFLVDQTDKISLRNSEGHPKIWSPFPLLAMTFVAIETLGNVIGDIEKIKSENSHETSKIIVTPIYKIIDKELSHKPSKPFYKAFEELHGKNSAKRLDRYSDVIHIYQRNTFNHSYQARGVYIGHDKPKAWTVNESEGTMVINPYLFWDEFKKSYNNVLLKITTAQEKEWRQNALKYFQRLLD
jgi:hypothetical protein